ncbi:MAG: hypothetical protein ACRESO_09430, partial [Gammaproteobacteria bacterium]
STLICATNRVLSEGRDIQNTAMTTALAQNYQGGASGGCSNSVCYTQVFAELNEALNSLPGHYLHTSVNAPALHA